MMKEIVDKLNKYTESYDQGRPEISDKEWDELYFYLKKLEEESGTVLPDSPTNKIHYASSVDSLKKVEHNHHMLSLSKTKDWSSFLGYFVGYDVIGMPKLDGLTCSLEYEDGKLIGAETRGDGLIGEDVLHNAQVIPSIPKTIDYKDRLVVDGEIICTYSDFAAFSDQYANPRNFASGSIRLLDSKECAKRKLTFVVWNIVEGFNDENSFYHKLLEVEKLGFKIVPNTTSFDWDAKEYLVGKAKEYGYPIDGLVGRFDDIKYGTSLGETDHHAKAAFAFKFYDETVKTTLRGVEWSLGRTGVLTPIALFDPVEVGGTTVERASLHNVKILQDLFGGFPKLNQEIEIFKANEIIPQVYSVNKETGDEEIAFPTTCPSCGGSLSFLIAEDTCNLTCGNNDCPGKFINKLDHFCGKNGLDIKGLSLNTLEKLYDWGWLNDFEDIFKLKNHRVEWIQKEGFGRKSVDNILAAIEETGSAVNLANFISALGIPQIGLVQAKEIAKHFLTWQGFRQAIDNDFKFFELDSFGGNRHYSIKNYDYSVADRVAQRLKFNVIIIEKKSNTTLEGQTICITGSLKHFNNRDELVEKIEQLGGKVSGSVSSRTSILINNDAESTSSKNVKAKELEIPIMSEDEFCKNFDIL